MLVKTNYLCCYYRVTCIIFYMRIFYVPAMQRVLMSMCLGTIDADTVTVAGMAQGCSSRDIPTARLMHVA